MYIEGDLHSGMAYCKKCGWYKETRYLGRKKCQVCQSYIEPVPEKYINEFEMFPDKETEELFLEECVKSSPVFDPELFAHWEEIYGEYCRGNRAAAALGEALLNGTNKGNKYGVRCPYCNATNVRKISVLSKAGSVGLFGVFAAGKVSSQWHCSHCGSDF